MDKWIYDKIIAKKEFSQLPLKDVDVAFSQFERRQTSDEEKIRLTRELLHKVFGAFSSEKLLNKKIIDKKSAEEILRKHSSTRERMEYYLAIYSRIFYGMKGKISVIDLGAGVNGFSYDFIKKSLVVLPSNTNEIASLRSDIGEGINNLKNFKIISLKKNLANVNERGKLKNNQVNYVGVEAIGQLVNLTNDYFIKEKIKGKAYHLSLFEIEELKKIAEKTEKPRVIFLFKTIDSLELLERDYSKRLILELIWKCDKFVVSFATRSMISRKKFMAKRYWFENFIKENFQVLDDFELGGERYVIFKKK